MFLLVFVGAIEEIKGFFAFMLNNIEIQIMVRYIIFFYDIM